MRLILSFILTLSILPVIGQDFAGNYKNYFGHRLQLNSDSTFIFEWRFDLIYNWAVGEWHTEEKILKLSFIPLYDTLAREGQSDSLVLSFDKVSNRISSEEYATYLLSSGSQSIDRFPDQLKLHKKRLYSFDGNGKIFRARRMGIWPQKKFPFGYKKWPTYYRREE